MKCLIDCDILLYEVGVVGQYIDEETQEIVMKSFDVVSEAFDQKVLEIESECWSTEESLFFITNNKQLYKAEEKKKAKKLKRVTKRLEANPLDVCAKEAVEAAQPSKYVPNFRDKVAVKKTYKGNRKTSRPLHYDNLVAYVRATREVITAEGCEADDLLAVWQVKAAPLTTIICSRDKDLKIVAGMHFGWACGYQPQYGPAQVTEIGEISLNARRTEIKGSGLKFFYSQILTGDKTDNYPGLPRCGAVKAFDALGECNDEGEMFEAVRGLYRASYTTCEEEEQGLKEHLWHREMNEQAQLAWMVCELDEEGGLVHYVMYDER